MWKSKHLQRIEMITGMLVLLTALFFSLNSCAPSTQAQSDVSDCPKMMPKDIMSRESAYDDGCVQLNFQDKYQLTTGKKTTYGFLYTLEIDQPTMVSQYV